MARDRTTVVYGTFVASIACDGRRSIEVRVRASPGHDYRGAPEPEVLVYQRVAATEQHAAVARFIGACSPEATRELVDALRRGLGEIERARPSGPGVAPGSWREQRAMGTAGSGAPTRPQDAPAGRRGDQ